MSADHAGASPAQAASKQTRTDQMFTQLRWNLAGKFLILSATVYVMLTIIAVAVFQHGLTEALDDQLRELATVMIPLVEYESGELSVREPLIPLKGSFHYSAPTISIFSSDRRLVKMIGNNGSTSILPQGTEIPYANVHLRTFSRVIEANGVSVGYIQVQLATTQRDRAVSEFLEAVGITAPILLLALFGAGYVFSNRALKPIEATFILLKQFMSDAGHELKTPIAVIHATCDNLMADLEENRAALERVNVISASADRMQRLVSDLLLLTKSEKATLTLPMVPLRFDMLLREVLGAFSDLFDDKGINLSADTITPSKVNGNKDALYRMLANLIENALNYTNSGGTVTVSLTLNANGLVLRVSDTGIGIPESALPKIFDRFYRVDESRARAAGGSGLGLAIVKAITESHNGTISVSSVVGQGSTFTISLPVVGQTSSFFGKRIDIE